MSGNYMGVTRNQDSKTPFMISGNMIQSGNINEDALPLIGAKKSFEAINGAIPRRASTRQGHSTI
jgi:hypothetical protein